MSIIEVLGDGRYKKKAANVKTLTACLILCRSLKFLRRIFHRSGLGKIPVPPAKFGGKREEGTIHYSCLFGKIPVNHHGPPHSTCVAPYRQGESPKIFCFFGSLAPNCVGKIQSALYILVGFASFVGMIPSIIRFLGWISFLLPFSLSSVMGKNSRWIFFKIFEQNSPNLHN